MMNLQQAGQPKSFNGYGFRKSEREGVTKSENKVPSGKLNFNRLASTGVVIGSKGGSYESPSHDRLVYITTCLIGHQVEAQVKYGSIYSGIFHATNADKEFGIILKMARIVKDGSLSGQKSGVEFFGKAPSKILIIPANELVQVIAKGVAVTRDDLPSESNHDMYQEIMVDSLISQSRHVGLGRELKPWVPDEDGPQCPELDNIFDGHWNRGWDQFETNATLFGVKSTFNEEIYTTKLEKGPQTRELEKQALRIAREIEGEDTQDLHLAEERGLHIHENLDIDEETMFSSVYRGKGFDDSGYDENEDMFDSHNSDTFVGIFGSVIKWPNEISGGKGNDGAPTLGNSSYVLASELPDKSYTSLGEEIRIQENLVSNLHRGNGNTKEESQQAEDVQLSKSEDSKASLYLKKNGSDKGILSPNATSYAPSSLTLSKTHGKTGSPGDLTKGSAYGKAIGEAKSVNSHRPSARPGLSPSSSVGSLSSEKSSLNPNAKEFKLNPNAKIFIPSQIPIRPPSPAPPSPAPEASFYFPNTVQNVPGMPMGIGIGPNFAGPQPIIYNNPQVAQMQSQAYFHPNGPQYGQLLGPRQAVYMPGYPPEMQYKGREY